MLTLYLPGYFISELSLKINNFSANSKLPIFKHSFLLEFINCELVNELNILIAMQLP